MSSVDSVYTIPRGRLPEVAAEYTSSGYTLKDQGPQYRVFEYKTHGSLLTHLALFFTVGWITLGVLNVVYGVWKASASRDRVRVEVEGE